MASNLTVISGTTGGSASVRAFGGQQAGAQDATSQPTGLLGLFGALLANANAKAATTTQTGTVNVTAGNTEIDLSALLAGLDGASGETGDSEKDDPDAIAAAMDLAILQTATTGPEPEAEAVAALDAAADLPSVPVDPKPMVDFIEALGALKASLDRGEPLDPDMLSKVQTALDGLAQALGLDLDSLPVPDDFAALLETSQTDGNDLAATLTQLLAPMAASLAQPQAETDIATDRMALDAQIKSLGDKLGALIAALEQGDVPDDKLAAIGMPDDAPVEEIKAALERFAALTKTATAVPEEPALAAPALKLTEPVLTGKAADLAATIDTAKDAQSATAAPEKSDTSADDKGRDDKGQAAADRGRDRAEPVVRDARTAANAAPAPTDASNTPAPSADAAVQQPAGLRVDASANPRIIQAGYQTSQQQLNLPQIAFELARQVQDGNTRFQIRLDPPELGRIDVRLDIDQSGQVNARLVVEKSETLDLMQRDQRGLERALQQAGLDSAKTNLEFSLKQNPFAGQQGQMGDGRSDHRTPNGASANDNGMSAGEADQPAPLVNLYRGGLQASGVNIIA